MPLVGEFHGKFWRARANPLPTPGVSSDWLYPRFQAVILMSAFWMIPVQALEALWRQLRWYTRLARALWWWRSVEAHERLTQWIQRLEASDWEQRAILDRVWLAFDPTVWPQARDRVRATATTPDFNQPIAWVEYSRAIKANTGQAQNVFRHLKVVHELRATTPLSNPEAHLLAELAYQGFAALGRPDREVVTRTILH